MDWDRPDQHGTDQEDHDGQLVERFAAVEVAELAHSDVEMQVVSR